MIKVIVAGSREFNDYGLLKEKLDYYLSNKLGIAEIEIVSGTARGADRLGERYAKERNLKVSQFPANWHRYGKRAGYLRNEQMARYATHCVVFWDGKSPGTKMMIELAQQYKLSLRIVRF